MIFNSGEVKSKQMSKVKLLVRITFSICFRGNILCRDVAVQRLY